MDVSSLDIQSFYPPDLEILGMNETNREIVIHLHSVSHACKCQKCGSLLLKHHGSHHRTVQDLPVLGKRVKLDAQIYDYECCNPECNLNVVTETFDGFLSHNSRRTERLEDFICILALKTNCEACSRILNSMNVQISSDTIIRLLIKRYKMQPASVLIDAAGESLHVNSS